MRILDAVAEDAAAVCQVLRRSISELCIADHKNDPTILARWLSNKTPAIVASWIAQPNSSLLIAVEDDQILGVGAVTDKGEITLNYVSPDARFQGVSRALLGVLEARAMEQGHSRCTLLSTETARRFYLAAGYIEDGASQGKFGTSSSYPMSKQLGQEGSLDTRRTEDEWLLLDALKQRTVIFGNSGAGKSSLAEALAALVKIPTIDLDQLHWEEAGYNRKRDEETAKSLVRDAAVGPRWVIEGVFGWLAEIALSQATALVWLDIPWDVCRQSLLQRGRRRGATDADQAELLAWAEAYWERQTSTSFTGHARLFAEFRGPKLRLGDRDAVGALLRRLENDLKSD